MLVLKCSLLNSGDYLSPYSGRGESQGYLSLQGGRKVQFHNVLQELKAFSVWTGDCHARVTLWHLGLPTSLPFAANVVPPS